MAQRSNSIDVGLAVLNAVRRDADKPNEQFTLKEIAEVCGCQPERVRQIEAAAMEKLRTRLRKKLHLTPEEFLTKTLASI